MIVRDPNWFAFVTLLLWGPLAFLAFWRLRPAVACFVVIVGAELLLPVGIGFSFKGFPDLGRSRIAALAALLACLLLHRNKLRPLLGNPWILGFVALLAGSSFATALSNGDPAVQGIVAMPAMRPYDGVSLSVTQTLDLAVPFALGAALFRTARDLRFLHQALVLAAVAYTLPILFELRMSPQLHGWFYGYMPHAFIQHMRGGGYRPMVFMAHGLVVSMFLATAVVAAVGLWRARLAVWPGVPAWLVAGYLMVVLMLSKSWAPVVYAAAGAVLLLLPGVRHRLAVASVLGAIVLFYPALRIFDLVPAESMVEAAATFSEDRAGSLEFRFDNEALLLERAKERLWFGWGTWGRNRVYDPDWGHDLSTVDGMWILTIGSFGVVGFAIRFALAVVPIWLLTARQRRIRSRTSLALLSSLALILAFRAIDLLPNADYGAMLLLYSGALAGIATGLPAEERARLRAARRRKASGLPPGVPSPVATGSGGLAAP